VKMLAALAPHLATPLTVQAIEYEENEWAPVRACEWHVQPGATTVEVNQFLHGCNPNPWLRSCAYSCFISWSL
jgi:hypothetical protein